MAEQGDLPDQILLCKIKKARIMRYQSREIETQYSSINYHKNSHKYSNKFSENLYLIIPSPFCLRYSTRNQLSSNRTETQNKHEPSGTCKNDYEIQKQLQTTQQNILKHSPLLSKISTILILPLLAAECRGAQPSSSQLFTTDGFAADSTSTT